MKRSFPHLVFLLALLLAAHPTAAQDPPEVATQFVEIPYSDVAPVIDGQPDPAYDRLEPQIINNFRAGTAPTDDIDLSGAWQGVWDETYLYVFVDVEDDQIFNTGVADSWQEDAVELVIDGGDENCQGCYDSNDVMYIFRVGDEPDIFRGGSTQAGMWETFTANVEWASGESPNGIGYHIEARIPWENVGVEAANGRVIGLDFGINDDDTGDGTRDHKVHFGDAAGDRIAGAAHVLATAALTGGPGEPVATVRIQVAPGTSVIVGESLTFDGSGSAAPGTIQTYEWDLGDGTTATGPTVEHTYTSEGDYTVALRVTDDGGVSGRATTRVNIRSNFGTAANPYLVARATAPPIIDGEKEPTWDNALSVEMDTHVNNDERTDRADTYGEVWTLWDDNNLYVFADVQDNELIFDSDIGNAWQDDGIDFAIDGGNEKCFQCLDENDLHVEFRWGDDDNVITGNRTGGTAAVLTANMEYAWATTIGAGGDTTGYTIEALVPLENFSIPPIEGTLIGLEFLINDDDPPGGNTRDHKYAAFAPPGVDNAYQYANVYGVAMLAGASVSAEDPGELPNTLRIEGLYPNPFNPSATLQLETRVPGIHVVRVANVLGQEVMRLRLEITAPGSHHVPLALEGQASGTYLVSVQDALGNVVHTRAMLIK